jgi:hypothetical protein
VYFDVYVDQSARAKRGLRWLAIAVGLMAAVAGVVGLLTVLLGPAGVAARRTHTGRAAGQGPADAINGARQTLPAAAGGTAALTVLDRRPTRAEPNPLNRLVDRQLPRMSEITALRTIVQAKASAALHQYACPRRRPSP